MSEAPVVRDIPRSARWLAEHRWLYVVPVLLPLSKAYAVAEALSARLLRRRAGAVRRHGRRVARMRALVRERERRGGGPICTARPRWRSIAPSREADYKEGAFLVPARLDDVLRVDTDRGTVTVGPAVTMGRLAAALPRGWTLPVLPELEDLTVGGLVMGYGIETSSHRHGLFTDNVESCEVLLAGGEVVVADRTRNADLFHALPWSRGTLGLLTSVRLRMVPAAPWVRLSYHRLDSAAALAECLATYAFGADPPDFVEGFHFSPAESLVVTGTFADRPRGDGAVNRMGRWYKPWFHEHARARGRLSLARNAEYVPLRDYWFRHSRGIFWAAEMLVPSGNHPLFRYALGWLMPPKAAFLKRTETPGIRRLYQRSTVTQEALVPLRTLPEAIEKYRETFRADRMWLCPATLRRTEPAGLVGPRTADGRYVDVAVVFETPEPVRRGLPWDSPKATRAFEAWLLGHGGFQVPYVDSRLSRDEFWTMFDGRAYRAARAKYGADGAFPDIYDKVSCH
ncbi:FAD-binding oxidoreductase [Streptomyces sp. CA-181903]|uniref:FAD-binding oxidoreductase n=1 Tax=Streptomyces sp. CA-181903 TaxID=3240055 RepID=UPI003D8BF69C